MVGQRSPGAEPARVRALVPVSRFDWRGYLLLAEELGARIGDEAALRSAISRAYYSALGRASELLRSEGIDVSPLRTHSFVWRAYKNSSDPRRSVVGMNLDWLRHLRDRADYASEFDGEPSDVARDAVLRAKAILQSLDEIRVASPADEPTPD